MTLHWAQSQSRWDSWVVNVLVVQRAKQSKIFKSKLEYCIFICGSRIFRSCRHPIDQYMNCDSLDIPAGTFARSPNHLFRFQSFWNSLRSHAHEDDPRLCLGTILLPPGRPSDMPSQHLLR
jgi:hypothetical protein